MSLLTRFFQNFKINNEPKLNVLLNNRSNESRDGNSDGNNMGSGDGHIGRVISHFCKVYLLLVLY